jgi:hypothetical protein
MSWRVTRSIGTLVIKSDHVETRCAENEQIRGFTATPCSELLVSHDPLGLDRNS